MLGMKSWSSLLQNLRRTVTRWHGVLKSLRNAPPSAGRIMSLAHGVQLLRPVLLPVCHPGPPSRCGADVRVAGRPLTLFPKPGERGREEGAGQRVKRWIGCLQGLRGGPLMDGMGAPHVQAPSLTCGHSSVLTAASGGRRWLCPLLFLLTAWGPVAKEVARGEARGSRGSPTLGPVPGRVLGASSFRSRKIWSLRCPPVWDGPCFPRDAAVG
ncbi:uncharacterized protein LOC123625332 [Lemur catta]|uniref:uncharacterized protein LOC123625332 n=1 Tax=Lemur catta TaxID=9447 RepID=UPI001E267491|nr:uncharacterized protein LOC123625332 [Lemur catta]